MAYRTMVIDNYGPPDEGSCGTGPSFETREAAEFYCRGIVDDFLAENYQAGMTAAELWERYTMFGEDPCVISDDKNGRFSGWDYAKQRCEVLCAKPSMS